MQTITSKQVKTSCAFRQQAPIKAAGSLINVRHSRRSAVKVAAAMPSKFWQTWV